MVPSPRTAVLMLTHRIDRFCLDAFDRLRTEGPPDWDYLLACEGADDAAGDDLDLAGDRPVFRFRFGDMAGRGYQPIAGKMVPGSTHWGMFDFALKHPEFDHIWQVEYDVTFTGLWGDFFAAQSNTADLLTAHIRYRSDVPLWHWWQSLENQNGPGPTAYLRTLNPIFRLSRRAILHLDACFRNGWRGHYEATLATLVFAAGMNVEEIGGGGPFVRPGNEERYYLRQSGPGGTLRWRPEWTGPLLRPDTLYHPVKSSD